MMALKDLLSLIDDKLKDVFHKATYDPKKDRDALVKRIEKAREKFLSTEPQRGRKDFSVSNSVVEYRPTIGGNPLVIEGREANYVPSERFTDFLDLLKAEVSEGRLDKEIEAAATESHGVTPTKTRKPRSDAGAGWSDERRARFQASIAARNAAKKK